MHANHNLSLFANHSQAAQDTLLRRNVTKIVSG